MSSIVICIYGTPRISVIKRLGFMKENGKAVPSQPWENVRVFFGQTCLRVEFDTESKKDYINSRVASLVALGRFTILKDVRVITPSTKIHYETVSEFIADTGDGQWKIVEEEFQKIV